MINEKSIMWLHTKWRTAARRHEAAAADCHDAGSDEEESLHLESARILRDCANDLVLLTQD